MAGLSFACIADAYSPDDPQRGGRWWQMLGHGVKLGRKKEEAIAALLTHRNTEEEARAIGVAPCAIHDCRDILSGW